MAKLYQLDYESPIGVIEITGTQDAITSILFSEKDKRKNYPQPEIPSVLIECYNQLDEYFQGTRYEFTIPYHLEGSIFQKKVWRALTGIPYAEVESYKDIAVAIENEKAVRAVGSANGKNKLTIVIPCHRVIGANGKLTGYAGRLWRKEWLLRHEKKHKENSKN